MPTAEPISVTTVVAAAAYIPNTGMTTRLTAMLATAAAVATAPVGALVTHSDHRVTRARGS